MQIWESWLEPQRKEAKPWSTKSRRSGRGTRSKQTKITVALVQSPQRRRGFVEIITIFHPPELKQWQELQTKTTNISIAKQWYIYQEWVKSILLLWTWNFHQTVSALRQGLGWCQSPFYPSVQSCGKQREAEWTHEWTLAVGLASKGVVNQLRDWAYSVSLSPGDKLHLWLQLGNQHKDGHGELPMGGCPLGTRQGGSNLESITIDRGSRLNLIKQISEGTRISGKVILPH